jgi:hypothetical protein
MTLSSAFSFIFLPNLQVLGIAFLEFAVVLVAGFGVSILYGLGSGCHSLSVFLCQYEE